jgi:DNA-binding PadR family transcriptional regulator
MTDYKLQANATLILSSLAEGERHGYAIRKDVERRTGEDVKLGVTTLYRLLKQLLDGGLVEESDDRPAPALDDERRRYYRLTSAGRRALSAELRRMERILAAARPEPSQLR